MPPPGAESAGDIAAPLSATREVPPSPQPLTVEQTAPLAIRAALRTGTVARTPEVADPAVPGLGRNVPDRQSDQETTLRPALSGDQSADPHPVPAPLRVLLSSGSYVRFRKNDRQWRAKYRVASFDAALQEQGQSLREEQVAALVELFNTHAADNADENGVTTIEVTSGETEPLHEQLGDEVMVTATAYDQIYAEAGDILDEAQLAEFEAFLASSIMRKEADNQWLQEFLEGLRSVGGTSVVVRAGQIMPGAFGLPAGGVGVEVDGHAVDPEALPPLPRRGGAE